MTVEQIATDVVKTSAKLTETVLTKIWTVVEAASEKKSPSEYLSPKGIQAMQGKAPKG